MSLARTAAWVVVLTTCTFFMHRFLRSVHYQRCDYDIIQVIFFKNSHMCTMLKAVIDAIEAEYGVLVRAFYDTVLRGGL